MPEITIRVPCTPVGQPRVRATAFRGHARMYDVTKIKNTDGTSKDHPIVEFKSMVRRMTADAYQGAPTDGPVTVDILAVFPRPVGRPKWIKKGTPYWDHWKLGLRLPHTAKPDRDNTDKAVLDAMKGIIFADDKQAFCGTIVKNVAAADEQPHVEINVTWE